MNPELELKPGDRIKVGKHRGRVVFVFDNHVAQVMWDATKDRATRSLMVDLRTEQVQLDTDPPPAEPAPRAPRRSRFDALDEHARVVIEAHASKAASWWHIPEELEADIVLLLCEQFARLGAPVTRKRVARWRKMHTRFIQRARKREELELEQATRTFGSSEPETMPLIATIHQDNAK
jgi:hypothetical protein